MKNTALISSFSLACALLTAQPNNSYLQNIIMPSPTAASLGKYGDIPVGYYTGVPNISIPIYTVSEGPLSLPISLSYHASGVKVAEAASWSGLNWVLNAGGMVSRTVQGLKDEDGSGGWYYHGDEIPDPNDECAFENFVPQVTGGSKDSEPDIFSFNFSGYGGKFYFDKTGALVLVPKQDIQIVPQFTSNTADISHLKGFVITAPDGAKYRFGDIGDGSPAIETLAGSGGDYPKIPSSWFLKKIETHDGKYFINLTYANDESQTAYIPSQSSCNYQPPFPSFDGSHTKIEGKRLSSITTTLDNVTFTPGAAREDIDLHDVYPSNPPKSLASISITSGTFQKKFDFTYDYWLDNSSDAIYEGDMTPNKRLRLLSVQEKSGDNTILNPPYTFEYFTKTGSPNFLPHRLSRSIDHWGFYNGKANGAYNSSTLNVGYQSSSCTNGGTCNTNTFSLPGGSDRETDETSMKYGTLKKVTYPTGGNTEFDFEANDYYSTASYTTKVALLSIPPASTCASFTVVGTPNPISFASSDLPGLKYELSLKSIGCPCPAQVTMEVKVYKTSGNVFVATSGQYQLACTTPNGSGFTNTGNLQTLFQNLLQANTNYRFEIFFSSSSAQFSILKETTIGPSNVKVGGLRVKQVKTHDGISTLNDIIRNYEYKDSLITTQSSGILYEKPRYFNAYTWYPCPASPCGNNCAACYPLPTGGCNVVFFDFSIVPISSFEGYHIGYKFVKEIFPGNGYRTFTYQTEAVVTYTNFPHPPAPARILAGNLKYSATRDNSANLKAYESHTPQNDSYAVSTDVMFKVSQQCGNFLTLYSIRTRPYREAAVTNSLDGVASTVTYTYDAQNRHLFPVSQSMTNSDGKVQLTEHTYNHDYTNAAIKTELLNRFIIAGPWKTSLKVNGAEVDGSEQEFAFFNNTTGAWQSGASGGSPRLYKFYNFEKTWNSSGVLTGPGKTLKATINSCDGKGNPASFATANWTDSETYTWNTAGLILTRTYKSHVVTYDYYPGTRLLRAVTDIDGRKTGFTYDKLMRLAKATKDNASVNGSGTVVDGNVKTEHTYHYKDVPDPNNWVKTKSTFTPVSGSSLTSTETFEYLDGIGRPLQTVKKAWSPAQKDVVAAVAYDNQGRVTKQYTPFETTTSTGAFAAVPGGQKHTLTAYEASPLGRPTSSTPPDWYATTSAYAANAASEVGYYNATSATSYYPANSLSKTTSTAPQSATRNIQTLTWKDKKGRTVATRRSEVENSTNKADTYNIYDDKDRVIRVLPPGTGTGDAGLRFEYAYDEADRMTSKKVPDAATVTMKYNLRDQLVLTQDGNLLAAGKWMLTKYDDYGRPLSSGLHTGASPDPNNAALTYSEQHTATTYGTSGLNLGKVTSAQTWMPGNTSVTRTFTYDPVTGRMLTDNGPNHLTGNTGSDNYTFTYDYAGNRLTETRAHKTSTASATLTLVTRNIYDHAGRSTALYHKINTNAEKQLASHTYDFRDRLIDKGLGAVTVGATNSFLQSVDYAYNEQNWLTSINGASSFSALSQDAIALCPSNPTTPNPAEAAFAANPDGNDIFKLDLYYNSPGLTFGSPTGQRNGNISQLVWQARGRQRQGYTLQYDYLDRLTTSYYADINSAGTATTDNKYQENIAYADARGNISSIARNGLYKTTTSATCWTLGQIDNLAYTYSTGTNRLQKIADTAPTGGSGNPQRNSGFNPGSASASATYLYDANGNMNYDPYKTVSLAYNHLNLPTQMTIPVGSGGAERNIYLLYDHSGKKLRKTVNDQGPVLYTQDYVSGLEYRTNGSGGTLTLEAIYHAEGRITPLSGSNYQYEYSMKDHLGNTRLTFADLNGNSVVDVPGDILQENHYYPFGLSANYGWMNNAALDNRYQYNGKELNDDFGVNLSDYGARWYDAAVGRWWSIDPNVQRHPNWQPYHYLYGNPIKYIDLDGRDSVPNGNRSFVSNIARVAIYEVAKILFNRSKEEAEYLAENPVRSIGAYATVVREANSFGHELNEKYKDETAQIDNAVRHTLGQALAVLKYGAEEAIKLADAHESNNANVISTAMAIDPSGKTTNSLAISTLSRDGKVLVASGLADSFADQLNNSTGRGIGLGSTNEKEAKQKTEAALLNGQLYQAVPSDKPNVSIIQPINVEQKK